jgi:hypothetical protein
MSLDIGPLIGLFCGGIFILGFAAAGVFLIYQTIRSRQKAEASQDWPATAGQITEARVSRHTSTDSDGDTSEHYSPIVRFRYQVASQEYEGSKIAFGFQQSFGSHAKAQSALARFPVGAQVSVYYDPSNPSDAVLERKAGSSTVSLVLGIIFLVVSLCLGCPALAAVLMGAFSST